MYTGALYLYVHFHMRALQHRSLTCAFIHVCMRNRGTARERKNSSHLHSVYTVAAVETNCQAERREGGDKEGGWEQAD